MSTSIRQETTRRIVDAALAVFSNVDFHQATIREIARRAGIAQATIYKHFESKEHLLHSIVAVKLEEMTQGLEESLLGVSGVLAKLRKMTWYILRFYETNPDLAWVLYVTTPPKSWIGSEGVQIGQRQAKILRGILMEGQTCGDVAPNIDARLAALMYFGGLHRIAMQWLTTDRSYSIASAADAFTDMFFSAIMNPERRSGTFRCPLVQAWDDSVASYGKGERGDGLADRQE